MQWRAIQDRLFGLFEREKEAPFNEFVHGMAKMVHAIKDLEPDWQRIEITRTATGIKWATRPNLDLSEKS